MINDNCDKCGKAIFEAIPKKTTRQDIIEFAASAPAYMGTQVETEGWIHPGRYCPNGCTHILVNYGSRDLFKKLEEDFELTHTVKVIVQFSDSADLNGHKIYLDGNIHGTRIKDAAPKDSVLFWTAPGDHRIMVTERGVVRLESNTIEFACGSGDELRFEVIVDSGALILKPADKTAHDVPK